MTAKPDQPTMDAMHKDPKNWKGLFYVNRKDPRIVVPKRVQGLGWTFNLAHPLAWLILLALVGAVLLMGRWVN